MRRLPLVLVLLGVAGLGVAGAAFFWQQSAPRPLAQAVVIGLSGDAEQGETVFRAAGCAACHMAEGAKAAAQLELSGGQRFASPFGTFIAPNISPDPTYGIGGWSLAEFTNAVTRGISPRGQHYFPVFPYGTYSHADLQDVADLKTFLDTLPAMAVPNQPHEVKFPFNIRRSLGLWKRLFLQEGWVVTGNLTPAETRGRYLVEALGHCAECHTPRNLLGGLDVARWLAGAPDPSGKGRVPNITPGKLTWSDADIASYLATGFTPDYDSVGGLMAHVVENLAHLPGDDRRAIAAYLKRVPAHP